MSLRGPLVLIVCLALAADADLATATAHSPAAGRLPAPALAALGCAEVSVPFLAALLAGHRVHGRCPSGFFGESEPYHEDKLWHVVGGQLLVELNYAFLTKHFDLRHPLLAASLLSLLVWTSVECRDGLIGSKFSLRDELGDLLGVALAAIELKRGRPLPIKVRVGVRSWPQALAGLARRNFLTTEVSSANFYRYMQADVVYCHQSWYAGLSVSRGRGQSGDVFAITFGFDIVDKFNRSTAGWWNAPLSVLQKHFNLLCLSQSAWNGD